MFDKDLLWRSLRKTPCTESLSQSFNRILHRSHDLPQTSPQRDLAESNLASWIRWFVNYWWVRNPIADRFKRIATWKPLGTGYLQHPASTCPSMLGPSHRWTKSSTNKLMTKIEMCCQGVSRIFSGCQSGNFPISSTFHLFHCPAAGRVLEAALRRDSICAHGRGLRCMCRCSATWWRPHFFHGSNFWWFIPPIYGD